MNDESNRNGLLMFEVWLHSIVRLTRERGEILFYLSADLVLARSFYIVGCSPAASTAATAY
jgi:hypothetical protein